VKRLLVHIGTHKTGSTSIQRSLDRAAAGGGLGFAYPRFDRPLARGMNHKVLYWIHHDYQHLPPRIRSKFPAEATARGELRDGLRRHIRDVLAPLERVVLSAEALSLLTRSEVDELIVDLREAGFERLHVVVYVRHPVSYYLSLVQQELKSTHLPTSPEQHRYGFRPAIEAWSERDGVEVTVRPFDRSRLESGCVVRDFLSIASGVLDVPVPTLEVYNSNETLSAEAMILLQRYRRRFLPESTGAYVQDANELVRVLRDSSAVIPQTRPRLAPRCSRVVGDNHADDLRWLAERFDVGFPALSDSAGGIGQEAATRAERAGDVSEWLAGFDPDCLAAVSAFACATLFGTGREHMRELARELGVARPGLRSVGWRSRAWLSRAARVARSGGARR
jgi:hypothetical protein